MPLDTMGAIAQELDMSVKDLAEIEQEFGPFESGYELLWFVLAACQEFGSFHLNN